MLQAIHLLPAFDLFVVVVAVDARWLHRTVGQIYQGQLAEPDQGATRLCHRRRLLEKIFQLQIWMGPFGNPATVPSFGPQSGMEPVRGLLLDKLYPVRYIRP